MRIAKLEIVRNTYNFGTQIQGRTVQPGDVVGQVSLKGEDGAEIIMPLSDAQIAAALAAVAPTAAGAMRDLGAAVHAGMFHHKPALEHAPSVEDFIDAAPPPAPATPALTLADFQVGQRWRTRSGQVATITDTNADDAGKYPILATLEDGSTPLYVESGRYFAHDLEDDRDLVALIDSPAPADTSTGDDARHAAENPPGIAVGQTWKMRNGDTALVEEIDNSDTHPVWARCSDGNGRSFSWGGRWNPDVTDPSEYDLVELVAEPAPEPQPCAG